LSTIFTVPKPDGTFRLIINLKFLNNFLEVQHFKMEDYRTVCCLLQSNNFMTVVDLKDAYHSVPIYKNHRKYLRFIWRNILYEYNCLCFGLATAPFIFTKLLKPLFLFLRSKCITLVGYLDDIMIIGSSSKECNDNTKTLIYWLGKLGFLIQNSKSQLVPSQTVKYLGFIFDSVNMTIELPEEKKSKIIRACDKILKEDVLKIQVLSELIGYLVASCPAVAYGPLYVRQLEIDKTKALQISGGNYDAEVTLSKTSRDDIKWWMEKAHLKAVKIRQDKYDLTIFTDASPTGWGAHCNDTESRGFWTPLEQKLHINVLELKAIQLGLHIFANDKSDVKILIRTDSTTAISYVNKYGGCRSDKCHAVAVQFWKWCEIRKILIHASYISSSNNYIADRLSRMSLDESDYSLHYESYNLICKTFGNPMIDYFSTEHSKKCDRFYSWFPSPGCEGVDAFSHKWEDNFYAFPPFNLIGRCLKKVVTDMVCGIVVVPNWVVQPWYPLFLQLCNYNYIELKSSYNLLICPYNNRPHPMWATLNLLAAKVSNKNYST
jgi:hypothetical protein